MCCFLFSSRRRHARLVSDWSSDVCSSDLVSVVGRAPFPRATLRRDPCARAHGAAARLLRAVVLAAGRTGRDVPHVRSEEHTSELQSLTNLVCRLLLEKKKQVTQPPSQSQH